MNIWALDKDTGIKHLLLMLEQELGSEALECIVNDDEDPRSIRLTNPQEPKMCVYIFTYGQDADHYGAHIEYPSFEDSNTSDTLELFDNLSFDALLDILKTDLGLAENQSLLAAGR